MTAEPELPTTENELVVCRAQVVEGSPRCGSLTDLAQLNTELSKHVGEDEAGRRRAFPLRAT